MEAKKDAADTADVPEIAIEPTPFVLHLKRPNRVPVSQETLRQHFLSVLQQPTLQITRVVFICDFCQAEMPEQDPTPYLCSECCNEPDMHEHCSNCQGKNYCPRK